MSYFEFLVQWYNWPYVAAALIASLAAWRPAAAEAWGRWLAHRLRLDTLSGRFVFGAFWTSVTLVGLTLNGAVHDYFPAWLGRGFVPVLLLTAAFAVLLTRSVVRLRDRYFPPIHAVSFGATNLAGAAGRVVSREVAPEQPGGRVQIVTSDGVLHIVRVKTRGERLRFGRRVVLLEYDERDGHYFVVSESGQVVRT